MTGKKQPDFSVATVIEVRPRTETEKAVNRWTNVGVGFTNKDTITVHLDALPLNGKLVLMKYEPKKKPEQIAPVEQQKFNPFGK